MINTDNMPRCLKHNDFDKWLLQFNINADPNIQSFIKEIKDDRNLMIKFVREEKVEHYGFLTAKEIRKNISQTWKLNAKAKELVSSIYDFESLVKLIDTLATEISNFNEVDYYEVYSFLKYLAALYVSDVYVLSETDDMINEITVYVESIRMCTDLENYLELYELSFIKELYKIYYRTTSRKVSGRPFTDSFSRKDYISDVVEESLACYYTLEYAKKYGVNYNTKWIASTTQYVFEYVKTAAVHIYPASGVYAIHSWADYEKIFHASLTSSEQALKIMFEFDPEIYYSIVNHELNSNIDLKIYKNNNYCCIKPYEFDQTFYEFLVSSLEIDTANSYISWISTAFEKYLKINYKILSILDYDSRIQLVNNLLSMMTDTDKTTNNQKSALKKLLEFLKRSHWNGFNIL